MSGQSFYCPITYELMENPYTDENGHTFEFDAIKSWWNNNHNTSPITNLPMKSFTLVPNRALKEAIDEFKEKQNVKPLILVAEPNNPKGDILTYATWHSGNLHIKLVNNSNPDQRCIVDLCCVIDVSGSMQIFVLHLQKVLD
jgi:hypothetical protein